MIGEEMMFDHYTEQHVTPSAATLIIRYATRSRLPYHTNHIKSSQYPAPVEAGVSNACSPSERWRTLDWGFRVLFLILDLVHNYIGIKASGRAKIPVVSDLMGFDIVLTTYDVLSSEVHFAQPPPERNMRRKAEQRYKPARSPLVQISWWRVSVLSSNNISPPEANIWIVSAVLMRVWFINLLGIGMKDPC